MFSLKVAVASTSACNDCARNTVAACPDENFANMDLSVFEDNSRNLTVKSVIPEITLSEPCCIGIDEAGRGPVLGKKAIFSVSLPYIQSTKKTNDFWLSN